MLVTADTADAEESTLGPRSQLRLLDDLSVLAGPDVFADSLVYSTPAGNTGWTAFRMAPSGHVTYHHWDAARPNLLQMDLFGRGAIDDARALKAVRDFWQPTGLRALVITRPRPTESLRIKLLRNDLAPREGKQIGLGPGDHLHLLVDQVGPARRSHVSPPRLDAALEALVDTLKMRGMTPVLRHDRREADGFAYDAIVGITTSHMSLRLRETAEGVEICLDVFSCRKFDAATVIAWLDENFPAPHIRRAALYNRFPLGIVQDVATQSLIPILDISEEAAGELA